MIQQKHEVEVLKVLNAVQASHVKPILHLYEFENFFFSQICLESSGSIQNLFHVEMDLAKAQRFLVLEQAFV